MADGASGWWVVADPRRRPAPRADALARVGRTTHGVPRGVALTTSPRLRPKIERSPRARTEGEYCVTREDSAGTYAQNKTEIR